MPPLNFQGVHAKVLADTTPEIDLEGSLACGKTTLCLAKELLKAKEHPGIWGFMCRYSDNDTKTKLRPAFEEICSIYGESPAWDAKELCYVFDNGSKIYAFGLKSVDFLSRYAKLRGLAVSRIYVDQPEEMPGDIGLELRARIRPDLRASTQGRSFPTQLTLSPNPPSDRHWIAKQYPTDNSIKGRKHYALSVYDNAHNLPDGFIASLEASYPPGHAKHGPMVLGKRGVSVIGDPIFDDSFIRRAHVTKTPYAADDALYEAFDVGKHNPCWIVAQRPYAGGWRFLGGIQGQDLFLEDFLAVVKQKRQDWFGDLSRAKILTCSVPSGVRTAAQVPRYSTMNLLRDAGFEPRFHEAGQSPDVLLAMIERLASYMRKRNGKGEEAIQVNSDESRFLRASGEGVDPAPFLAQGFEAGMVWDEHFVSVGSKEVRQPKEDDWFEHGLNCAAALELNFGADQSSEADRQARLLKTRQRMADSTPILTGPQSWLGA